MTTMIGIMIVLMVVVVLSSGHMRVMSEKQITDDAQQVSSLNYDGEK